MSELPALSRFLTLLSEAIAQDSLVKLTLGKPRAGAPEPSLRNVFARPVALRAGRQVSFVYRHATRDITKNLPPAEAEAAVARLLAESFFDAHLFTTKVSAQLEQGPDGAGTARLRCKSADAAPVAPAAPTAAHDRAKHRVFPADAPWLRALGVTNDRGKPREGMAHKFRQIERFAELLGGLLAEAGLAATDAIATPAGATTTPADATPPAAPAAPLRVADMGAGKGYLTFALAALLGDRARITGIERRPDLVATCKRVAAEAGFAARLDFVEGDIPAPADLAAGRGPLAGAELDVLIALHACDTATDDALAAGHLAGARLLVVSPCCQKELRPRLVPPPVLAEALRHGIFEERQAEFVTDALRAQVLECVGYRTKVFEFISTEHTAKNLMIAAVRLSEAEARSPAGLARRARAVESVRAFAAFYGIREQRLARHLGVSLEPEGA